MSLIVSYEITENVLIVRLVGELDHHEAERLREEWTQKIYASGVKHIIVNLKDLTFMDSSGLGVLIGRYKEVLQLGGEMLVCHVNPFIERLFELSGLFKIVHLAESEQQALHTLGVAS